MRLRRLVLLTAPVLLGSAMLAGAYVFLSPIVFPGPDVAAQLALVDAAIAGGYTSTARAELLAIRRVSRSEADALRILKRAFVLSREAGDFHVLAVMSDRALASRSNSSGVRLVAAYAYLRTGRLSDAESAARPGLPSGAGDLVRAEIALRRGGAWKGSDSLTRGLLGLETSRRAQDFIAAARLVDDKRLSLDAALLSLEDGELERARLIALSSLQESAFDEPAALIAYDSGDFDSAVERFTDLQARRTPRADIALLLADCYRALGRNADDETALQKAVALDPKVSWTPYANLALDAQEKGDVARARDLLAKGRNVFPGSRDLAMALARLELSQGNQAAAISLLDGLVAQRPDDTEAALLRLNLGSAGMSTQAYQAQLWKLFGRSPSDQRVFMTLISALIATHDWEAAAIAMHQHELAHGTEDADSLFFRSLVEAAQGNVDQAIRLLRQAVSQDGKAPYRYDLALLLLHAGSPEEALEQLDQVDTKGDARMAARFETLRGRCLLATGDDAGARSAFLRARTLDPELLVPGLELRKLEARGDQ